MLTHGKQQTTVMSPSFCELLSTGNTDSRVANDDYDDLREPDSHISRQAANWESRMVPISAASFPSARDSQSGPKNQD
jgi:hypothetical protein